ncbi:MAG: hypothetical protein ACFFC6_15965 [Promethearchaeota archaeon]
MIVHTKEERTQLVCLEPPKNHKIHLGIFKSPIFVIILIVILILTLIPPSDYSSDLIVLNGLNRPTDEEWISQVIPTIDGGFTLLGHSFVTDNGKINGILLKCDNNGEIEWNMTIGGEKDDLITSILQTTDGGFVFTRLTDPFIDFDYSKNLHNYWDLISNKNSSTWLTRVDRDGIIRWNKPYQKRLWIDTIFQTSDEGLVLIGLEDKNIVFIDKTDKNGILKWSKTYDYSQLGIDQEDSGLKPSCAIKSSDNGYLLGITTELISFDSLYDPNTQLYILKFNRVGKLQWSKKYTQGPVDIERTADAMIEVPEGYIIMGRKQTGWSYEAVYSQYLLRIDQNGFLIGSASYAPYGYWSHVNSIVDLLTGYKNSGIVTQDNKYLIGNNYGELFKTTKEGVVEWNQTYPGKIFSICQIVDGGIILAGTQITTLLNGGPSRDIWVAKTDDLGSILWEKTIDKQENNYSVKILTNNLGPNSEATPFLPVPCNMFFLGVLVIFQKRKKKIEMNPCHDS